MKIEILSAISLVSFLSLPFCGESREVQLEQLATRAKEFSGQSGMSPLGCFRRPWSLVCAGLLNGAPVEFSCFFSEGNGPPVCLWSDRTLGARR
jgi:hypothetical protein